MFQKGELSCTHDSHSLTTWIEKCLAVEQVALQSDLPRLTTIFQNESTVNTLIVMHQNRPSETNRWCHSISVHSVCGLTWRSCFLAFGGTARLRWIRVSAPEVADYLTHFCCSSEFLLQQDCGSRIDLKQMCLNPFINIEVYDFSFRYSCRISSSPVYS